MSEEGHLDPSLDQIQTANRGVRPSRGQLKIFLGAAAGVGKTYKMLEEARALKAGGNDIVIAVVETHGRPETQALLEGLEIIPRRNIEHKGITLGEMDMDAVLARHPAIALVDELAHTNAPESRYAKRYQDVEELLESGINVYTTLNIQHIESLNDIVYQITGVRINETLPDKILDLADVIEVVDLPPDELLQRFKEGKVYIAPQAKLAMSRFFRKGNLLGLRELALRYAAHKVDEDTRIYMKDHGILGPWPAGSQLLVCLSTSPLSERLVRIGQNMAKDMDAEWYAIHVESTQEAPPTESAKDQLERNLILAEELGAKVKIINGYKISDEILSFAKKHNITLIIVGLPRRSLWNRWLRGSVINEIVERSDQIHVLVIGSTEADSKKQYLPVTAAEDNWNPFYRSFASVAIMTSFCWMFHEWMGLINTAMMLVLPVVYSGMTLGRRAGLMASILAVISLDFFFVPPRLAVTPGDVRYLPLFIVFFIVGMVTSVLTDQVRWQAEKAHHRERFVSALYSFSRDLMAADSLESLLRYATKEIAEAFDCEVMILLPDETGKLQVKAQMGEQMIFDERRLGVANWVLQHGQPAGRGTETISSASLFYLPMKAKEVTLGVLGVKLDKPDRLLLPEQRRLLEAFTNVIAMGLVRSLQPS